MTLNKIVLPLLVISTLWLSAFPMVTTNTIAPISLDNTAIIAGATYFKIHTIDDCALLTQTVHYSESNPNNLPMQPSTATTLLSFCNKEGDTILYETATNIKSLTIEGYAENRLDPSARHQIIRAVICQGFINFHNKNDDLVSQYEIYENDGNDITIKEVQEQFKNADDIDLTNLSKIEYILTLGSIIAQGTKDLCILQ